MVKERVNLIKNQIWTNTSTSVGSKNATTRGTSWTHLSLLLNWWFKTRMYSVCILKMFSIRTHSIDINISLVWASSVVQCSQLVIMHNATTLVQLTVIFFFLVLLPWTKICFYMFLINCTHFTIVIVTGGVCRIWSSDLSVYLADHVTPTPDLDPMITILYYDSSISVLHGANWKSRNHKDGV